MKIIAKVRNEDQLNQVKALLKKRHISIRPHYCADGIEIHVVKEYEHFARKVIADNFLPAEIIPEKKKPIVKPNKARVFEAFVRQRKIS
jgi:hypothetical protein